MMALVQKQMEAEEVESPPLLEVGESSGGGAKVVPYKAMAAALVMMSDLSPSLAFDVGQVKQAVRMNAPAISKAQLNKAVEAAMPVIAAAVLTTGALPASAGDAGAGEQIFSGNCAACHQGGQNVIMPEKTLEIEALTEYLDGGANEGAIMKQVKNGKGAMPAFGGKLSDDDIVNVATYVLKTAKDGAWE